MGGEGGLYDTWASSSALQLPFYISSQPCAISAEHQRTRAAASKNILAIVIEFQFCLFEHICFRIGYRRHWRTAKTMPSQPFPPRGGAYQEGTAGLQALLRAQELAQERQTKTLVNVRNRER